MEYTKGYKRICCIDGCDNVYYARGYCIKHWEQYYKEQGLEGEHVYEDSEGKIYTQEELKAKVKKWCSVDGCNNIYYARGYCREHYYKFKGKKFIVNDGVCGVPFCSGNVLYNNCCTIHNSRKVKYGRWWLANKRVVICKADGCNKEAICYGYCSKHYSDIKKTGSIQPDIIPDNVYKVCKVDGCNNTGVCVDGYCLYHHRNYLRTGNKQDGKVKEEKRCSIEGCDVPSIAKGLCMKHYVSKRRGNTPVNYTKPKPVQLLSYDNIQYTEDGKKVSMVCLCDGCKIPAQAGGFYCSKHQELLTNKDKEFIAGWSGKIKEFMSK